MYNTFSKQISPAALLREMMGVTHFHQEHEKVNIFFLPKNYHYLYTSKGYQSIFRNALRCITLSQNKLVLQHYFARCWASRIFTRIVQENEKIKHVCFPEELPLSIRVKEIAIAESIFRNAMKWITFCKKSTPVALLREMILCKFYQGFPVYFLVRISYVNFF